MDRARSCCVVTAGTSAGKFTRVANPVGYADGYPRSLSDKGYVLIRGKRAPILGRVCMDQMMADVTEIEDADFLDEVVLVGKSGGETDCSGRFKCTVRKV